MKLVSLLLHDVYRDDPSESGFPDDAAARYKLPVAEFDTLLGALARAWTCPATLAPHLPATDGPAFAVTVDDGGESFHTVIADRLERLGWRGHCFVCTGAIGRAGFLNPRQLSELDDRGHVIGAHSATHPTRFSACSRVQMLDEWRRSRGALEDILGREVRTASLPGGFFSRRAAETAGEAGLRTLFTSEPTLAPYAIGSCTVIGRLTVRRGRHPRAVVALARGARAAVWREQVCWTAKKALRPILGSAYPRLGHWAATRLGR